VNDDDVRTLEELVGRAGMRNVLSALEGIARGCARTWSVYGEREGGGLAKAKAEYFSQWVDILSDAIRGAK
jgi:hypothetical protein